MVSSSLNKHQVRLDEATDLKGNHHTGMQDRMLSVTRTRAHKLRTAKSHQSSIREKFDTVSFTDMDHPVQGPGIDN